MFEDSKTACSLYSEIKKQGVKCTPSPTPRKADACCGVSILYYNSDDRKIIEEISIQTGFYIKSFWECENEDDPKRNRFC